MPSPLITINDFIGDLLIEREGLSRKDSEKVKKIFRLIPIYTTGLPLRYKIMMFMIMRKYRIKMADAVGLYYKYNNPSPNYRFEGYLDGKLVKTVVKEYVKKTSYRIEADSRDLEIDTTYDVTRIAVSKLDQNGNILPYAFDAFTVRATGGIEVIGPKTLALSAGETAFWVKTTGESDVGCVTVCFDEEELTIDLNIKRR